MGDPEKRQSVLEIILRKYGEVRPVTPAIKISQPSEETLKRLEEALLMHDIPKSMDSGAL